MPTKYCKDCTLKLGLFKKKFHCHLCSNHFCDKCFSKVKANEVELFDKLLHLQRPSCLRCIVFHSEIKREHLFLLPTKQLRDFLTLRNINFVNCTEKYHIVDLVMDFAETNGMRSGTELEYEVVRRGQIEKLREAECSRQLEEEQHRTDEMHTQAHSSSSNQPEDNDNTDPSTPNSHSAPNSPNAAPNEPRNANINSHEPNEPNEPNETRTGTSTQEQSYSSQSESSNNDNTDSSNSQSAETNSENNVQNNPPQQYNNNTQQSSSTPSSSYQRNKQSPMRHQASGQWCTVDDIKEEEDVSGLSVLELKQILTANFINYHGCVEKSELINKVKMLYNAEKLVEQKTKNEDPESYERDICKICMDHAIDCVLLDCGHMVSCTKCGKRLAQCPICRSLVARVVHVFRV